MMRYVSFLQLCYIVMPVTTYTNARFAIHRKPTAPRSASESTNTIAPSFLTSYKPPQLPKYRTRAKNLQETSMHSRTAFDTPEINQMNANLVSFATIRRTPTTQTKPAGTSKTHIIKDPPTSDGAGTRIELAKHRPIAQHIGATHNKYPHDKVGDTLLRQQAIMAINSIPGLIERLHQDISDIRTIRRSTTATPPQPPEDWHNAEEEPPPRSFDLPDTTQRIRTLETLKAKMVGIQLHFDPGKQTKIGAKDMQLMRSEELIEPTVQTLTQREAHSIVSKEIHDIDEKIASLQGEP